MGTPVTTNGILDALSDWAARRVCAWVRHFPSGSRVLDVGAGWGKYAVLLSDYRVDACEVWWDNIYRNQLDSRYRQVFHSDICDLVLNERYEVIIMSDVFEHIARDRAQAVLPKLLDHCEEILIVVPFLYPQGPEEENPYEEHLQPDLTPELMTQVYPQLMLQETGDGKGLYTKAR